MHSRWAFLLVVVGLSSRAHAQEDARALSPPEQHDTRQEPDASEGTSALSIEVHTGTTAPLDVFLGANVVLYERLLLTSSVGVSVYRRTVESVARQLGDEETAEIVSPLLFASTLVRLGVGLRPFGNGGPELLVGYARIMGSARWDAGSFGVPERFGEISASVTINAVYAELGWAISIGNAFLRPAVGFTRALGSRVAVDAEGATSAQSEVATARATETVEDALDSFGITPTFSLSLGGRFSFRR